MGFEGVAQAGFSGRIVQDVLMELDVPDIASKRDVEEGPSHA